MLSSNTNNSLGPLLKGVIQLHLLNFKDHFSLTKVVAEERLLYIHFWTYTVNPIYSQIALTDTMLKLYIHEICSLVGKAVKAHQVQL